MPNAHTPSFKNVKIPAKLFLMGEYIAIQGGPAVVSALPYHFEWYSPSYIKKPDELKSLKAELFRPHTKSPAGMSLNLKERSLFNYILKRKELNTHLGYWFDPFKKNGGFGGSTAEYLASLVARDELAPTPSVWNRYRRLHSKVKIKPSGFDLISQMEGGAGIARFSKTYDLVYQKIKISPNLYFMVLSASHLKNRKVNTHDHLRLLDPMKIQKLSFLKNTVLDFGAALEAGNLVKCGILMGAFRKILFDAGLEHPQTTHEMTRFEGHKDIAGVKGIGALLADGYLVLLQNPSSDFSQLAQSMGLKIIHAGSLGDVEGLRVEKTQ